VVRHVVLDRRFLGLVFAVGAALLCFAGLYEPWNETGPDYGGLLLNIGSELIGIVVTVVILDFLNEQRQHDAEKTIDQQNERRRCEADVRKVTWDFLHDIDYAVWAWLGGRRRFDIRELIGLLGHVTEDDPLPSFIRTTIADIGSRAAQCLELQQDLITVSPPLEQACNFLVPLAVIQDTPWHPPSQTDLAIVLSRAIRALCMAVGAGSPQPDPDTEWQKDSQFHSQQWRFYGRVIIDRAFDASKD
jgi:hypothetical protein